MNQKTLEEEEKRKQETRGELCFVCHLLMRHMWESLETMSHAHNGTVATIGSKQAPSARDDCAGICYLTADFSVRDGATSAFTGPRCSDVMFIDVTACHL